MRYDTSEIRYVTISSDTLKARITNYGCTLLNLWVVDANGGERDIVLGYEDILDYYDNPSCFGSCILPNANRIGGAKFTLGGKTYTLDPNDGDNNLHSGAEGLHKRLWEIESQSEDRVTWTTSIEDMDMGMPGNRRYTITYRVDGGKLSIEYTCLSDADTLFNPTNHSYFNLMGHDSGDILSHELIINASSFTPSDEESIVHGEIRPVSGTPMDYTMPHQIGERIDSDYDQLKWGMGYDHNYVLDEECTLEGRPAATLRAPDKSLTLNIYTTAPCLQLYTGNYISPSDVGKGGVHYSPRAGVALETQFAPNAINTTTLTPPIARAGVISHSKSVYEVVRG